MSRKRAINVLTVTSSNVTATIFKRRMPRQVAAFGACGEHIRISLKTDDFAAARAKRDIYEAASQRERKCNYHDRRTRLFERLSTSSGETVLPLLRTVGRIGRRFIRLWPGACRRRRHPHNISESQIEAGQQLKQCRDLLGIVGYELASMVASQGLGISDVATSHRKRLYAADSLKDCLDVWALYWGYSITKITSWRA